MKKITGECLASNFLGALNTFIEIHIIKKGNPLYIMYNEIEYVLFFRCMSHAGKGYPENSTRVQLPYREEFNNLSPSSKFLLLGYDQDNDIYVCWDPNKVRARLNKKKYVSFFARKNVQSAASEGHMALGELSNGDQFVTFKLKDILTVLDTIESKTNTIESVLESYIYNVQKEKKNISNLEIVARCMNEFGANYPHLRFIDWANKVKEILGIKKND